MKLTRAFDVRDKDVVAFVGGGGKSSAMFRLAQELAANGKRVVTTTTTRIFASQISLAPAHVRIESDASLDTVLAALRKSPNVLVVGGTDESGKAMGMPPALVDALIASDEVDNVIVEADGSRMRPFKSPGTQEPVIPSSTTLLVPIVGIDVLGKPLDDTHVHRSALVSKLTNVAQGTPVSIELVAQVLAHPQGGLRNKPAGSRLIPLVNKVESARDSTFARELAYQLLRSDEIAAVAAGAIKNDESPISALFSRVSAVVLAAGGSSRMNGLLKQLLPWRDTTFVGNAVQVTSESRVSETVVVIGNQAQQVLAHLNGADVRVVYNPDWATGRASSVRAGISAVDPKSAAAIFINTDQPFLNAGVINAILARYYETRAPIIVPTYDGETASPVLIARELFPELVALHGEQGGRDILARHSPEAERVAIPDTRAALDLDTREEYEAARKLTGSE